MQLSSRKERDVLRMVATTHLRQNSDCHSPRSKGQLAHVRGNCPYRLLLCTGKSLSYLPPTSRVLQRSQELPTTLSTKNRPLKQTP